MSVSPHAHSSRSSPITSDDPREPTEPYSTSAQNMSELNREIPSGETPVPLISTMCTDVYHCGSCGGCVEAGWRIGTDAWKKFHLQANYDCRREYWEGTCEFERTDPTANILSRSYIQPTQPYYIPASAAPSSANSQLKQLRPYQQQPQDQQTQQYPQYSSQRGHLPPLAPLSYYNELEEEQTPHDDTNTASEVIEWGSFELEEAPTPSGTTNPTSDVIDWAYSDRSNTQPRSQQTDRSPASGHGSSSRSGRHHRRH